MLKVLSVLGKGVKRALGKDGGSLKTITDIAGNRDQLFWIALVIRALTPVVVAGLAYWFASLAGIPVAEFLETMNQLGE